MGKNQMEATVPATRGGHLPSLPWEFAPLAFEGEVVGQCKRICLEGHWIYFARFEGAEIWAGPFLSQGEVVDWATGENLPPLTLDLEG